MLTATEVINQAPVRLLIPAIWPGIAPPSEVRLEGEYPDGSYVRARSPGTAGTGLPHSRQKLTPGMCRAPQLLQKSLVGEVKIVLLSPFLDAPLGYGSNFRSTTHAFWPPKPKLFDRTVLTSASRATFGT